MTSTVIKQYIVERDGEARVADRGHLKAEYVARMHVDGGRSIEYVMEHYGLTRAQVHAVLAYFYENQEVLDAEYDRAWDESQAIKSADFEEELKARREAAKG